MAHIASCIPLSFRSVSTLKKIYLFSVQFIFVKILSLESLATYHLENHKNIPIVSEFDETFPGHWISRDESYDAVHIIIRDLENFVSFPEPLWQFIIIIIILPFLKISNFSEFYKYQIRLL